MSLCLKHFVGTTLTLWLANFFISSCSLFKIWRFGLFFLAYCWSSITLLSEFSCKTNRCKRWTASQYINVFFFNLGKNKNQNHPSKSTVKVTVNRQWWKLSVWSFLPSWPFCCSLFHTYGAESPSFWREDEASAVSSEMRVACQPSCSCLASDKQPVRPSNSLSNCRRSRSTYTNRVQCASHMSSHTRSSDFCQGSPQI